MSTSHSVSTFTTTNLGTAAFLVAGKHLSLLRVELSTPTMAVFVFADPDHRGAELECAYLTEGEAVPAHAFQQQLRILRRLIAERQNAARFNAMRTFASKGGAR